MKVLTAEQMRAADAHAIEVLKTPAIALMETAATHVSRILVENYQQPRIAVVVCGRGNNGGDGMAVARLLKQQGWTTTIILPDQSSSLKKEPAENWTRAIHSGVRCIEKIPPSDWGQILSESEVIVDALFGTGLSKPLEGKYAQAVEAINSAGKEVWSIDVPSGLNSDSGEVSGRAVYAKGTVALAALKYCHVLPPACELCGRIYVVDIGIPAASTTNIIRSQDILQLYPFRKSESHKGTYGHVLVIGGSRGKSGAAYMTAKAALRSGAGLVTVFAPSSVQLSIAALGPEVMTFPATGNPDYFTDDAVSEAATIVEGKTVLAIGPGIGTHESTSSFFRWLIETELPMVIDADGLNLAASDPDILKRRKPGSTVLTPHPGEMARLLNSTVPDIQKNRIDAAKKLSADWKAIVVLKGFRTIIADPDGHVWINPTGSAALASAGTGDVLTGAIAGYIAQNLPPLQASLAAVYTHGFTANLFEQEYPQQAMNAMDIPVYWNRAVQMIRANKSVESEYLQLYFAF